MSLPSPRERAHDVPQNHAVRAAVRLPQADGAVGCGGCCASAQHACVARARPYVLPFDEVGVIHAQGVEVVQPVERRCCLHHALQHFALLQQRLHHAREV